MSYGSVKRELAKSQEAQTRDPAKCEAIGCPCRATISLEGGRWCCTAHAFSAFDRWPAITGKLRANDWVIAFIDDVRKMDAALEDWRGFSVQFWTNQDEHCVPDPIEECSAYLYRMRGELQWRCGLSHRPNVRRPKPIKVRGNAAQALEAA